MQSVWAFVAEHTEAGRRVALVTVTETTGSSPASVGQVMAVCEDGSTAGTVGGGATEYSLTRRALAAIEKDEKIFSFDVDHAENGMVCGGGMKGFGNVLGNEASLVIFGGGHVGQRLAALAVATGFSVAVVEDRPGLEAAFEKVRYVLATPDAYADKAPVHPSTYVVICTRGHSSDDQALRFCLGRETAYLGMIGSVRKVKTLFDGLRKEGVSEEVLARVYTPIGLDIASTSPAEIAVSILAEILLVKNKGCLRHRRDRLLEN